MRSVNQFKQVTSTTPRVRALLKKIGDIRSAQGRNGTRAVKKSPVYREAFRLLQASNPATSYVAIRSYIMLRSKEV